MHLFPSIIITSVLAPFSITVNALPYTSGDAIFRRSTAAASKIPGAIFEPPKPILPETRNVKPIACHSHNDYKRKHPLVDALENGCVSIEADIWYRDNMPTDLLVGHEAKDLKHNKTLKSLYIYPILERLEARNPGPHETKAKSRNKTNGIFFEDPAQTLVVLLDFKTGSNATYQTLMKALQPWREGGWLSYWDPEARKVQRGALTVVASGKSTFAQVTSILPASGRQDIFLDAPAAALATPLDHPTPQNEFQYQYNPSNSYYASTKFAAHDHVSRARHDKDFGGKVNRTIEAQVQEAKKRGLGVRYWDTPSSTDFWEGLWKRGVGVVNVDHLTLFREWWDKEKVEGGPMNR